MNQDEFVKSDARLRLEQLLAKKELTEDEIEEAYQITEKLDLNNTEPDVELDLQTVRDLGFTLQNLKAERKALELQAEIRKERGKILELKKNLDRKMIWCDDCKKLVPEEEY